MRIDAYTDGSYSPSRNRYGSGVVLLLSDGRKYKLSYGGEVMGSDKQKYGSTFGELKAVEIAASHAIDLGCSDLHIHHDLLNVKTYAVAPPKDDSPEEVKKYNERMRLYMKNIPITFEHVKSHSGDVYNQAADREARIGAGITAKGSGEISLAEKTMMDNTDDIIEKYSDENELNRKKPIRYYFYASLKKKKIYSAVIRDDGNNLSTETFVSTISTNDPVEIVTKSIMDKVSNEARKGSQNVVVFSEFKNIIKYGNKPVNPNSHTVSDFYKRFSCFCDAIRNDHVSLTISFPASGSDQDLYSQARNIALEMAEKEKGTKNKPEEKEKKIEKNENIEKIEKSEKREENENMESQEAEIKSVKVNETNDAVIDNIVNTMKADLSGTSDKESETVPLTFEDFADTEVPEKGEKEERAEKTEKRKRNRRARKSSRTEFSDLTDESTEKTEKTENTERMEKDPVSEFLLKISEAEKLRNDAERIYETMTDDQKKQIKNISDFIMKVNTFSR